MIKLVTSQLNVRYLTGFTGSTGIFVENGSKKTLIVDGRYTEQAGQEVHKGIKVIQAALTQSLLDAAIGIIRKVRSPEVGIEDDKLDVKSFEKLKAALGPAKFGSVSEELRTKRCVKSPHEIVLIRKAALIADVTYDCITRMIKPGITEKDIAAEMDYLIRIMGGDVFAFETLVSRDQIRLCRTTSPARRS